MKSLVLEIGAGELFDRLTILEIKARHATETAQRQRITQELRRARDVSEHSNLPLSQIAPLVSELREVNERLWTIEDQLRLCEVNRDFGSMFVELSRSVYKNNDLRAAIKRRIDERLTPSLLQDKIYAQREGPLRGGLDGDGESKTARRAGVTRGRTGTAVRTGASAADRGRRAGTTGRPPGLRSLPSTRSRALQHTGDETYPEGE